MKGSNDSMMLRGADAPGEWRRSRRRTAVDDGDANGRSPSRVGHFRGNGPKEFGPHRALGTVAPAW